MASFYTSVERTAADILYVGYEGNRRVVEKVRFQPTLFIPTRNESKYRTLDGVNVDTIQPGTMMDCRDFIRENEATNFRIYGNRDYIAQYIGDRFPNGCEPDMSLVNVMYIDIEVQSDQGFPEPALPWGLRTWAVGGLPRVGSSNESHRAPADTLWRITNPTEQLSAHGCEVFLLPIHGFEG